MKYCFGIKQLNSTTGRDCLPGIFVSEDEGGCKEKVEILGNLRDHWVWAYRGQERPI